CRMRPRNSSRERPVSSSWWARQARFSSSRPRARKIAGRAPGLLRASTPTWSSLVALLLTTTPSSRDSSSKRALGNSSSTLRGDGGTTSNLAATTDRTHAFEAGLSQLFPIGRSPGDVHRACGPARRCERQERDGGSVLLGELCLEFRDALFEGGDPLAVARATAGRVSGESIEALLDAGYALFEGVEPSVHIA